MKNSLEEILLVIFFLFFLSWGKSVFKFNVNTREWTQLAELINARHGHACMLYGDGVLVTGGIEPQDSCCFGSELRDVSFFNLTSNNWECWPQLINERTGHSILQLFGYPVISIYIYRPLIHKFFDDK